MTFQISPGITVKEIDKTTVIPNISTTVGGFAGVFRWGPAGKIVTVSDENGLVAAFGKPSNTVNLDFLIAAQFLKYGNNLKVVRALNDASAKNATAEATTGSGTTGTGLLIKNSDIYDLSYSGAQGNVGPFAAKYPGALGNGLIVSLADADTYSKTMTVSTTGTALTGTGFTAGLAVGSKILDAASGELRTVVTVTDNTNAVIDSAFTVDLSSDAVTVYWKYYDLFQVAPAASVFAAAAGSSKDEIHVVVVDGSGDFSGKAGTVLETYEFLSKASDAKLDTGASNYYRNVINGRSKYVYWMDHVSGMSDWGSLASVGLTFDALTKPASFTLAGGADGTTANGDYLIAYDIFLEPEADDVSLLIAGSANTAKANYVIGIAEQSRYMTAYVSPELADVVDNVGSEKEDTIEFRNTLTNSSFAFCDSGWHLVFDKYNEAFRWLPLNADTAGLVVRTDYLRAPWISPAGFNRGGIRNSIRLAYNPKETDRDALYAVGINPVCTFPGEGTILYGDKTMLNRPSAFDRIGVRRMFSIIQKQISNAAKGFLFEQNTASERSRFKNLIDSYLRNVQSQQGLEDFRVIIDETNNTPDIISANTLVGDIYIKPVYSINFIKLNFIAVRTGVDFNEVVQSFN